MVEVIVLKNFADWYEALSDDDAEEVGVAIDLLEQHGVSLGAPRSSDIKGTRYPLRELRIQSHGRPLRVMYAFDPKRQAVLILGGDKTGDDRFYQRLIPQAERLWDGYLAELAKEEKEGRAGQ